MKKRKVYRIEAARPKRTVRKHLNADALIRLMREDFQQIPDHRAGNAKIPLADAMMSALAMFQLKDPSLPSEPSTSRWSSAATESSSYDGCPTLPF
ncbi:MAG: hypothetical protein P1P81_03605 [Desulfobulbales bacterium]|nr:hypothetical protein [Desulfobulbales bacterium]